LAGRHSGDSDAPLPSLAPGVFIQPTITLLDGIFMMSLPSRQEMKGLHGVRRLSQGAMQRLTWLKGLSITASLNYLSCSSVILLESAKK